MRRSGSHESQEDEAKVAEALRESQEGEAKVAEELERSRTELEELRQQLLDQGAQAGDPRIEQLQEEVARLTEHSRRTEAHNETLASKLELERDQAELKCYRAVDAERRKWEEREKRLLELQGARERSDRAVRFDLPTSDREQEGGSIRDGHGTPSSPSTGVESHGSGEDGTIASGRTPPTSDVTARARTRVPYEPYPFSPMTAMLTQQQLPPINKFSGEDLSEGGEKFQDWIEQLEMVASICHWDNRTKLVNLTTRLKGQAYAFYRSCTTQQRGDYVTLVAALTKRFTPVRLKAVQSSLFHERKQKPHESVDAYAQDLRRLFYSAYPRAQQGSQESDDMGCSVLAYQFVAGLQPEIRVKLAGVEGHFDQLLSKARFEEAKRRELIDHTPKASPRKPPFLPRNDPGEKTRVSTPDEQARKAGLRCFHCRGTGHFARNCPQRGRAAPVESHGRVGGEGGRNPSRKVAAIVVNEESQGGSEQRSKREKVAKLRQALQEAEVDESLSEAVTTMRVLKTGGGKTDPPLGPTLTADVRFEGAPVRALIDTGSPVTIVSLSFLLQALAKQRGERQTPAEWETAVRERLDPPAVTLQNYGGDELSIVRQITASISRENHTCQATVLVQKDAPLDLLLGTDLQSLLGFLFLQTEKDGVAVDLLQTKAWEVKPVGPTESLRDSPTVGNLLVEASRERSGENMPAPAMVRLIKVVRLPARHGKLVKAHVGDFPKNTTAIFESSSSLLGEEGVTIEDAATQLDDDHCVTLVVHNNSLEPVHLNEGEVIGSLQAVTLLPTSPDGEEQSATQSTRVRVLYPMDFPLDVPSRDDSSLSDREHRLLDVLDWEAT